VVATTVVVRWAEPGWARPAEGSQDVGVGLVVGARSALSVARTRKYRSPYPGLHTSAPGFPERSALEPLPAYLRRRRKHRRDHAKWAGQVRALKNLEKKSTSIPKQPYDQ
jgi:hypothetical protein